MLMYQCSQSLKAMKERMAVLNNLAGKQEQILQQLGPNNPLVNLQQYSNTLTKMIEMAGFKDAQSFINTQFRQCHQCRGTKT